MSPVSFRPATPRDYPAICGLTDSEAELFRIYPRGRYPLTPQQIEKLARERIALTVAEDAAGHIIGFANLYDHAPGRWAFIGNLIIATPQRGKGLGKALLTHMIAIAFEELALPEVRISVFADNTAALLLYRSVGFTPYDIEERKTPQGEHAALVHLSMTITPPGQPL